MDLAKLRNIGISAHIDSGKTTLSERILFYAGRIHRMQEVKGEGGATMDYMDLERERGITITSAATSVHWDGVDINLIDTPGHVDFTVEVERSLRVLDGAILVLCAVGGVQSQSMTVDRQMKRYHVPRLAFINKMDRTGADYARVVKQLHEKLDCDAVLMQLPIGNEDHFEGVIDLITQEAIYFDGNNGEKVRREPVPAEMKDDVVAARQHMLEQLSMYSDELMELMLAEEEVPLDLIHSIVKAGVSNQDVTPVYMGTAYRNKGVQALLDAVVRYLPSPLERQISAKNHAKPDEKFPLEPDPKKPFVGMAFKIVEDPHGQLTFFRIYQGTINKGEMHYNQRTGQKHRFSRIVKMHADKREEVDTRQCRRHRGRHGHRLRERRYLRLGTEILHAGKHVHCRTGHQDGHHAAGPRRRRPIGQGLAALHEGRPHLPRGHRRRDCGNGDRRHGRVASGHLRRTHPPRIQGGSRSRRVRRSAIAKLPTKNTEYNFKHKKQTGGSGQYGHIVGTFECLPEGSEEVFEFEDKVIGGRIPKEFIPSVEKGFRDSIHKGPLAGFPIVGVKAILEDGSYHDVDSSDMAFQTCARNCFRETFLKMKPALLEPIMKLEVEVPITYQGSVTGELNSRRGMILSTDMQGSMAKIDAEVPLAETFGYSTDLRSMTQGQGTFTMEFCKYRRVPASIQETVIAEKKKQALVGAK